MPPKRAASKANLKEDDKQIKEPIKRSTRGAKNKRELSDEEPIDTKKKKVADKPTVKVPPKETKKRSKATVESIEENIETTSKSTATTKRKRTATVPKETKSAKIKKDVNDNELLNDDNEEQFNDDEELVNEDNDKPTTSDQKKPTRGRGKKTAANTDDKKNKGNFNEQSVPVKRGVRSRKKATDLVNEEAENVDKDDNDQIKNDDILNNEDEKIAPKRNRNKKQVEDKPEVIEDEQPKKRGRGRKQVVEPVVEQKEEEIISTESQQTTKRGRTTRKTIVEETVEQQKEDVEPVKKKGKSKKALESESNKLEVESQKIESQPVRKGRSGSKQAKETLSQEDVHSEAEQPQSQEIEPSSQKQKPTAKRGRRAPSNQKSKKEENVDVINKDQKTSKKRVENKEEIIEQEGPHKITKEEIEKEEANKQENEEDNKQENEEDNKEPEQLVTRNVRGLSKQTANKELNEELNKEKNFESMAVPKRGRRLKKDQEENNEIIETQSQPVESESPVVPNKRGRRPTKKVIENNELLETQSQPTASKPAVAGRRGRKKEEKVVVEQQHDEIKDDNQELEDDEDDNKSEKELVIDLPDEQPVKPKQNKGRKAKETVKDKPVLQIPTSDEVDQQKEPQISDEKPQPPAKRGRGKKQPLEQEKEVPSTKLPTNKRKQEDIIASSNENLDQIKLISKGKNNVTSKSKNEEIKRPIKRGRHIAITEAESPKEPVELINEDKLEKEPEVQQQEKIEDDKQYKETNEREDLNKSVAQDSSSSSQIEYDLGQNDINKVMEEMKSIVEETIAAKDDLSSLNETTTENDLFTSKDSDDLQSLNELTGEIYSAKELEEYSTVSDSKIDFKLSYQSVELKNNFINETTKVVNELPSTSNTFSFTATDNADIETQAKKRIKLFSTVDFSLPETSGTVVAFGEDNTGALGQGKIFGEAGKKKPVKIKFPEDEHIFYINTLSTHSACINTKGQLYTFGNNDECALGRKTNIDELLSEDESSDEEISQLKADEDKLAAKKVKRQQVKESTPMICDICVNGSFKIYKVTTGDSHTAVLTTKGSVFYWGNFRDKNGKVGLSVDKLTASLEPVEISEDLEIVDIASGADFILLLDSCGTLYSLGVNDCGQLGRLDPEEFKLTEKNRELFFKPHPVKFPSSTIKIDRIWAGEFNAFARSTDNRVFAWGLNNYSQLGFSQNNSVVNADQIVYKPKEVSYFTKLGSTILKIVSGQHHSLALDNNSRVFAFGRSTYGRLGLGKITEQCKLPTLIETFKDKKVIDIACGVTSSFAITEDGKIYSWGMASIALGHGDIDDDVLEPTLVEFKSMNRFKAAKVSAGSSYCLVLGKLSPMEEARTNDKLVKNGVA